jgi:hypothetical protein
MISHTNLKVFFTFKNFKAKICWITSFEWMRLLEISKTQVFSEKSIQNDQHSYNNQTNTCIAAGIILT